MHAALVYAKFAPFHTKRLETSGALGSAMGHTLAGIEIADTQRDYEWPNTGTIGTDYLHTTLFPGQDYWTLSYRRIRRAICRRLDQLQPDVVVLPGYAFKESLAGLGWCLRRGVPRVLISDSQEEDTRQLPPKTWLKSLLVRRFQAGLVGGRPHVRYLEKLGMPRTRCLPGCDVVDNSLFERESTGHMLERHGAGVQGTLFSSLRLLPRKNVVTLLEVLANQALEWTWTIAGSGPQRSEIEERIDRLGLRSRVRLLGHVDYFSLPTHLGKFDVYIQPSLSEPWALAVNEAMACGLPVAVSRRSGCHEDLVEENVNGVTFDPTDPEDIAEALRRLWGARDRWPEMGRASKNIISRWGLDLFAQNLWRACEYALNAVPEGLQSRVAGKTLSLVL